MSWTEHLDGYCERTDPSLWSEPVNALTNVSFVVAAVVTGRMARRTGDRPGLLLALTAGSVGVGSFLFHTVATRWSMYADVWPIRVFVLLFVVLAVVRLLRAPVWVGLVAASGFVVATAATIAVGRAVGLTFNGSIGYAMVPVSMSVLAAALARRDPHACRVLLAAAAVFVVSLALRTVDRALCAAIPLGTHFGWHLLNGVVTGVVVALYVRTGREPSTTVSAAASESPRAAQQA